MKKFYIFILSLSFIVSISVLAVQPDTLKIMRIVQTPTIDAIGNDAAWDSAQWVTIDQVWIPWKATVSATDFSGKYKVLWSKETNKLYFLAEITDDVFRDGYVWSATNGNYPDYDIFEVFIDADHSGGLHVFDGGCTDTSKKANCWGANAQNAFSYHISVNAPADSQTITTKTVEDITGTDWGLGATEFIANYADHFPEFAFHKNGNNYTYEFSLKVYKDTYNPKSPSESDLDVLTNGKYIGLSTAYCDDDHATGPATRDNFIGSTKGDSKALENNQFNQTWKNASYYGTAILTQATAVTGINLVTKTLSVPKNQPAKIIASVKPADATNQAITFTSLNTGIASVDSAGNVKGVAVGSTKIVVKTKGGNFSDTTLVTVVPGVGIAQTQNESLSLYSANNKLQIKLKSNYTGNVNIAVYNVLGVNIITQQLLKDGELFNQLLDVNVAPGLYIVRVSAGGQGFTGKVYIR